VFTAVKEWLMLGYEAEAKHERSANQLDLRKLLAQLLKRVVKRCIFITCSGFDNSKPWLEGDIFECISWPQ
jgi:hypothetical protein